MQAFFERSNPWALEGHGRAAAGGDASAACGPTRRRRCATRWSRRTWRRRSCLSSRAETGRRASDGMSPRYPFSAIVGQEPMKLALVLNAINPRIGGVLIRGEKGTAKSTAARGLLGLLPPAARWSTAAASRCASGSVAAPRCVECAARVTIRRPRTWRQPAFVELPVGATEDRVIGTLDLERILADGQRHFEPGLLARANRGLLYVDEVNLLPDHLVDTLLDAAAMGVNTVEREGVSFTHPAAFVLVGTMNPEEGDLRPQLLDRFALAVDVEGMPSTDGARGSGAPPHRLRARSGCVRACAGARPKRRSARASARRRTLLPSVAVPDSMLDLIARICTAFEVDGLRADIVIYKAAATLAAYAGRARGDARGCAPGGGAGAAASSPAPAVRPTGAGPTAAERRRGRVWRPRRSVATATGWSTAAR